MQKQLLHSWVLHEGSETMQRQTWIVPGGIEHAAARSQAIVRCQHHQTILLTLNFKRREAGLLWTTHFQFRGKLLVNKKIYKNLTQWHIAPSLCSILHKNMPPTNSQAEAVVLLARDNSHFCTNPACLQESSFQMWDIHSTPCYICTLPKIHNSGQYSEDRKRTALL